MIGPSDKRHAEKHFILSSYYWFLVSREVMLAISTPERHFFNKRKFLEPKSFLTLSMMAFLLGATTVLSLPPPPLPPRLPASPLRYLPAYCLDGPL
jgi:hypothetical protein